MNPNTPRQCRFAWILLSGFCLAPAMALAEDDYNVTMRMVADEEALDNAFVQEMQIPESVNDLSDTESPDQLDANELSNEAWDLEEGVSSQSRETRDAFGTELPGEDLLETPIAGQPGTDLPGIELPGTELPTDGDLLNPDLDVLNNSQSTLDNVTNQ
ncbi:hypothetical protein KFJ24_16470 [Marinobacter sediminum]|uniref:hypothetical protein n=1 Tax=Marinobacter sediminum TaxID=256323 RepID=UPI00202E54E4|nr:hypothetical protein [Marinobacter sediminum]MCM0614084.1 hypothetical protein [Marinobacter sediminum]